MSTDTGRALVAGQPCPTCGATTVAVWFLDCPCGADSALACAKCELTPAANGWAHVTHHQTDLFAAVGL